MKGGQRGTSPVKLTSRFPEATTPSTLASDDRLTASVDRRGTFLAWSPMLRRVEEVGTPPRPNRAASPGLVPWLLRYHLRGTSCIPPFLKFEEQVLYRCGPAQVGLGDSCESPHRLLPETLVSNDLAREPCGSRSTPATHAATHAATPSQPASHHPATLACAAQPQAYWAISGRTRSDHSA